MREVITHLRGLGHTVRVLAGSAVPEEALSAPISAADRPGALRRFLRGAARDVRQLAVSWALARKGLRIAARYRPDVIYERADFMWLTGWLLARWTGIPRVVEVNGLYSDSHEHGWRHVSDRFARYVQRAKTAAADRAIAMTRAMKEDLAAIGVPEEKILVQHAGAPDWSGPVDPREAAALRRRLGLEGGAVVGYLGFLLYSHGVDTLIRAVAQVGGTGEVRLLVVGAGHIIEELRSLADRLGIGDKVVFTGPVPPREVPLYLASMDICVVPRHGRRNSPLKLFEYGMAGKPVIAATTAGILEVWRPGVDGLGIRNGNLDDLAQAIRTYLINPDLARRHARTFHRKVRGQHTWAQVAQWTAGVLEEVVASRRRAGGGRR